MLGKVQESFISGIFCAKRYNTNSQKNNFFKRKVLMFKFNKIMFLFISCVLLNSYVFSMGEREQEFALCEKLFSTFVQSDKCAKIFKKIIFDKGRCCKVLFNGDKGSYNGWLNVPLLIKVGKVVRLGTVFDTIIGKKIDLFKESVRLGQDFSGKISRFFYEDKKNDITWYSPTFLKYDSPTGQKETVCVSGLIYILNNLLSDDFYFESYYEDFAMSCRIFTIIFMSFLLDSVSYKTKSLMGYESVFLSEK